MARCQGRRSRRASCLLGRVLQVEVARRPTCRSAAENISLTALRAQKVRESQSILPVLLDELSERGTPRTVRRDLGVGRPDERGWASCSLRAGPAIAASEAASD
jgi:hypothetical protein